MSQYEIITGEGDGERERDQVTGMINLPIHDALQHPFNLNS